MAERVPTGPGWWWRRGRRYPFAEEVTVTPDGDLFIEIAGQYVDDVEAGDWLAPIPTSAECEAFAAYKAAVFAIDDSPTDSEERDGAFEDWEAKRSRLHAAIRAEREVTT